MIVTFLYFIDLYNINSLIISYFNVFTFPLFIKFLESCFKKKVKINQLLGKIVEIFINFKVQFCYFSIHYLNISVRFI